jgi:Ca-activated chloride channel homolog
MTFANPGLLWLLLLLPVLAWYARRFGPGARARFRFPSLSLVPEAPRRDPERALSYLRLAALALLIVAAARPQKGSTREEVTAPATDILLVLDTSGSMAALDFQPKDRLEGAKEVIRRFVENRPHDRIGLVVFAGLAFTQCPLTLDHAALLSLLDKVKIGMVAEDRTAVGSAIAVAAARLKRSDARSKTIVLLTDGRSNAGEVDPLTAAKAAAALGVRIYAVGAGKRGGSEFPVQDPVFGRRIVMVQEDLDEDTLQAVAAAAGGRYFRATSLDGLRQVYDEIDRLEKTDVKTELFSDRRDAYFPWLLAGFLLAAAEAALAHTAFRRLP